MVVSLGVPIFRVFTVSLKSFNTVFNAIWYLRVKVYLKTSYILNEFSGLRKFTLGYQEFEITGVEI